MLSTPFVDVVKPNNFSSKFENEIADDII